MTFEFSFAVLYKTLCIKYLHSLQKLTWRKFIYFFPTLIRLILFTVNKQYDIFLYLTKKNYKKKVAIELFFCTLNRGFRLIDYLVTCS